MQDPPFRSLQSTSLYEHTRPRMWELQMVSKPCPSQKWHGFDTICNNPTPPVQILSALGPMPLTVLFSLKAHSSGGKGLCTLKEVTPYKHIPMCFLRRCGIPWIARLLFGSLQKDYRVDFDTICNDPRKSASHICAIPQKDQSQLRLLVIVNKTQIYPVNTRCGTHHHTHHTINQIGVS